MTQTSNTSNLRSGPDDNGLFGAFGGRYVAETLMPLILDLAREYEAAKEDPAFKEELAYFQRDYVGRPSPLYFAERLTEFCGGAKIYLKREELNTPARTRSTTASARFCWRGAWARNASSPRPVPACTAWRPLLWPRVSVWTA